MTTAPCRPGLIETHSHLNHSRFDDDLEGVLANARAAGVTHAVVVGFDLANSRRAVAMATATAGLSATVGVHPHDAGTLDDHARERLRDLAADPAVVAIGETGLDFYRNLSPAAAQQTAFEWQLQLAAELALPVVIHDRDAHDEVLQTLAAHGSVTGVVHCFSGDWNIARRTLDLGFYIGITATVTYPKSTETREVARRIPVDRLLVETDCPYLVPQFCRNKVKRNEPAYLTAVVEQIAAERRMAVEDLVAQTRENSARLFGQRLLDSVL